MPVLRWFLAVAAVLVCAGGGFVLSVVVWGFAFSYAATPLLSRLYESAYYACWVGGVAIGLLLAREILRGSLESLT